jgi:hypothetical protein
MARDVQYIISASVGIPAPPLEVHYGDESAVSFYTSTAIGTALETITQSHEILCHSRDLLGWVALMGMVLLEFCLPF